MKEIECPMDKTTSNTAFNFVGFLVFVEHVSELSAKEKKDMFEKLAYTIDQVFGANHPMKDILRRIFALDPLYEEKDGKKVPRRYDNE